MLENINLENSRIIAKHSYCTLFDSKYLIQGLALHNSLERFGGDFILYVLAMDKECFEFLKKLDRKCLIPISLEEILNDRLLIVREKTNAGQFCWVCQPEICDYVLRIYSAEMIVYLDADQYFFSSPKSLFIELENSSVSLVPHNYAVNQDQAEISGTYCVQFNAFRNDDNGYLAINEWRKACSSYCKTSPYKFPGQKNLDSWPKKLNGIKVIENIGAGIAPWNVSKFTLSQKNNTPTVNGKPIIFYHFHQYKRVWFGMHLLSKGSLPPEAINLIYKPYILEMRKISNAIMADRDNKSYLKIKKSYCFKWLSLFKILRVITSISAFVKIYHLVYRDSYFK